MVCSCEIGFSKEMVIPILSVVKQLTQLKLSHLLGGEQDQYLLHINGVACTQVFRQSVLQGDTLHTKQCAKTQTENTMPTCVQIKLVSPTTEFYCCCFLQQDCDFAVQFLLAQTWCDGSSCFLPFAVDVSQTDAMLSFAFTPPVCPVTQSHHFLLRCPCDYCRSFSASAA